MPNEKQFIEILYAAALRGEYWDYLARLKTKEPYIESIILNIVFKCKENNLGPIFEKIKEKCFAEDTEIRSSVPVEQPNTVR